MRICDATFVVTDVETTGVKASADRVIELAAVRVRGGEVVGRFEQLINPGRSVPRRITQITGISTAMVFDKPAAAEVLPRFLAFLGEDVLVAHNLPFDERFINAELRRLGRPPLPNRTLCTLRLARRLLPGLKSKGLSSVADFYGLAVPKRHRALGDAEATAVILRRFFAQLAFEHEIETMEELLAFQRRSYRQIRRAPRPLRRLRREVLPGVPERPGVYFMKGKGGAILYVGKAKRLGKRVRSYFSGVEAHAPHRRKLVAAVRDVAWQETPSELDALLLESRLIKAHKPRFNRAGRRYKSRPFIRLDPAAPYPRVSWTNQLEDDGAEYFGPLRGRRQAELVLDLLSRFFQLRACEDDRLARGRRCLYADLGRCMAPCEGEEGQDVSYAAEVRRVRALLTGEDRSLLGRLEEKMQAAARALAFEKAARYRDWHDQLRQLQDRQQVVGASVLEHNAVLVLPEGAAGRCVQLFCVRFGRHVETITLARQAPSPEAVARVRLRLAHHFQEAQERPEMYAKRAADEIRLLVHWMHRRRTEIEHVRWQPGGDFEAFVAEVLRRTAAARDAA